MGALHAGHAGLIEHARSGADFVAVSIFVNPLQFGPGEDYLRYPRPLEKDLDVCRRMGADLVFAPEVAEMYAVEQRTFVEVTRLGDHLCGPFRPGHFRGVATVCLKLFTIVRPDVAYFGQKDAQQVEVVRRMIRDLDLDLELRVVPTVRDPDGLALSSRNVLLSPEERERALQLPRALATKDAARARALLDGLEVDYLELAPFDPPVLAAAVRVGSIRLIDNVPLDEGGSP